jgi:hypothetical protein
MRIELSEVEFAGEQEDDRADRGDRVVAAREVDLPGLKNRTQLCREVMTHRARREIHFRFHILDMRLHIRGQNTRTKKPARKRAKSSMLCRNLEAGVGIEPA